MAASVRTVVISEEARERQALIQALDSLPGVQVVAEVDRVCQMGRQAGQVDADCVVLDIDRYPLAGTLGLAQARGTFPNARIIILARFIPPRYLRFLRESGASCCIDKDEPAPLAWLGQAVGEPGTTVSCVRSSALRQSTRQAGVRTAGPTQISA